jgi:DNA-binding SARP family transcriptional activator
MREAEEFGWDLVRHGARGLRSEDFALFLRELLPGWYDDWVIVERERLGQLQIRFLEALCRSLTEVGRLSEALDVGLRLVALDEYRERSQDALIRVYLAEGDLAQARRQLDTYTRLTVDQFGCLPTAQLRDVLADAIAAR